MRTSRLDPSRHVVVDATNGELEPDPYDGKNPAAVELGRLGGLKGGRARAEKLSPAERSAIARKAARARWGTDAEPETPGVTAVT